MSVVAPKYKLRLLNQINDYYIKLKWLFQAVFNILLWYSDRVDIAIIYHTIMGLKEFMSKKNVCFLSFLCVTTKALVALVLIFVISPI